MSPSPRLSAGLLLAVIAGASWYAASGSPPANSTPAAAPLALSAPYTHDNLTVYVVRGPDEFDAGKVMTLQEALERGLAVVHETGDVNMLAVENRSEDEDLFLQSGDIVKGGKQDRLIASDMLVPPKSGKVACPANCCEQSRWTGRGQEAATHFARSTDFAIGNDIKIANASRDQGEVWQNVENAQKKLSDNVGKKVNAAESPTSLQLALEDKDLRAKLADYEKALTNVANYADAVGVVVAVNGKVIAADVYGSSKLFKKVWPKLLKAAAADAFAQMPKTGSPAPAPTLAEAKEFLASAAGQAENQTGSGQYVTDLPNSVSGRGFPVGNGVDPVRVQLVTDGIDVAANPTGVTVLSAIPAPSGDVQAQALPELGLLVQQGQSAGQPAGQPPAPQPDASRSRLLITGGSRDYSPRSTSTNMRNIHAGNRASANPSDPTPRQATANASGIVVVESRVPAQPSATVHRSYLKK